MKRHHTGYRLAANQRRFIGQLARFGVSTGFSALMSFGLPILLHEGVGLRERVAVAIGFAVAYLGNLVLLRVFVFRSTGGWMKQVLRYIPVNGSFRVLEYLAFLLLFERMHLDYRLAMLLVLGTSASIKFFAYRLIFLDRSERAASASVFQASDTL